MIEVQNKTSNRTWSVHDNELIICKKSGKELVKAPLNEVILLHYNLSSSLKIGNIIIFAQKKVYSESFQYVENEIWAPFYSIFQEACECLDLSYMKALNYSNTLLKEDLVAQKRARDIERTAVSLGSTVKKPPPASTPQTPKKLSFMEKNSLRKKTETQVTCSRCQTNWFVNDAEILLQASNNFNALGHGLTGNHLAGSLYANKTKNPFQCPQCGSQAITKKKVTFYTDKKGNFKGI